MPYLLWSEVPATTALLPVFFLGGTAALTCWSAAGVEVARRKEISLRLQLEQRVYRLLYRRSSNIHSV